jgi:hypothetical protein
VVASPTVLNTRPANARHVIDPSNIQEGETMHTDPSGQFSDWLAEHRSGSLDDELTAALVELAEKVVLEGKAGTLTLKLSLSEKGGGVIVAHEVKVTAPRVKTEAFYWQQRLVRVAAGQAAVRGEEDGMETTR